MLAPIMEFAWADMAYPALVVTLGYVALGLTGFASALISVPLLAWRWPLVDVVPLQLFAMDMAKLKNYDVDKPRNLAKSVTVE